MESYKNPLEAYKTRIANEVLGLSQVKNHIKIMYRNLAQPGDFDEPVSPCVETAVTEAVRVMVDLAVEDVDVAVNSTDPDFRKNIISRVDTLIDQSEKTPAIERVKNELRVAFIKTLGIEKPRSPAALIRHFDLSFAMFFNVVAQASLYLMNKIDIKHLAMTDEETALFQTDLANIVREKGGDVKIVKEGESIEDVLRELEKRPKNTN